MNKTILLDSAKKISKVSANSAEEYIQKSDQLITEINSVMLDRLDLTELVGKNNIGMMKDNHANHVRFIGSILLNYNPEVFVETVLWVFRAYRSHGFSSNYWAAQLNAWVQIINKNLSPECYKEVYPYYEWMQVNIPLFVKLSEEKIDSDLSMH